MNIYESDILNILSQEPYLNQRLLSEQCGHSLGIVNRSVKNLILTGYLGQDLLLTEKAFALLRDNAPKNAIILAAGVGMRMVPINTVTPKGLLEVHGEPLIERLIRQLHQVGISKIYVVVGFLKEQYEYLIDSYGVELIVNSEYTAKNNLHSLSLALPYLSNSYIIPCDIWCKENPFHKQELYGWYMVSSVLNTKSPVRVNRKQELTYASSGGNTMIGICYLPENQAAGVRHRIQEMHSNPRFDNCFWEDALSFSEGNPLYARIVSASDVAEVNTYEQLQELDQNSDQLKSDAISVITEAFAVSPSEIKNISVLKKGMTNRSFLFTCKNKKYIMRIPGEGTDQLINRREEYATYQAIRNQGICDNILYINPKNGYKITEFIENARTCDPLCEADIRQCMARLRQFHQRGLKVAHTFDLFQQILFYENLWNGQPSVYKDYQTTKEHVFLLKHYIDAHRSEPVLTHIDAVPDNFLFAGDQLFLIDWEYAGMQDPHVDIAMFCIYSLYNREQADHLIDLYFENSCSYETRIKIYCYIAVCGLLWSNWCEYKRSLGVDFGEYSLRQYRYAKEFYRIVKNELEKQE